MTQQHVAGRQFLPVFGMNAEGQTIERVAVEAVRQGYAVVPLPPLSKKPTVCTLTAAELKAAGPKHLCGVHHAISMASHTSTKGEPDGDAYARRVFARACRNFGEQVNIGIVAHPSRLICVDADNAAGVTAFAQYLAEQMDDDGFLKYTPTVRTPGVYEHETWKHKDGGHFLFALPDGVELALGAQVIHDPAGYDIRWGWSMSVVPPSVRTEGPYTATGNVPLAPQFLLDRIQQHTNDRLEIRAGRELAFANDVIARWSLTVPWSDLLEPDGWTDSSRVDQCGCPIYEKPGGGSTFKSATAHSEVCTRYELAEGHGPLHVWTTDPPAPLADWISHHGSTVTKLTYVAVTRHAGDIEAAKIALGIDPDPSSFWTEETEAGQPDVSSPVQPVQEKAGQLDDLDTPLVPVQAVQVSSPPTESRVDALVRSQLARAGIPWTQDRHDDLSKLVQAEALRELAKGAARALTAPHDAIDTWLPTPDFVEEWMSDEEEPEPTILVRTDGQALIPDGRVSQLVGKPGAAKTWTAILAALQVLSRGGSVAYYDMEDARRAFRSRCTHIGFGEVADTAVREGRLVWIRPGDLPDDLGLIVAYAEKFTLVVFDVTNRLISRLGGNPSSGNAEVMRLYDELFDPIAAGGTAVLVLDHPPKKGWFGGADLADLQAGGGALKLNNLSGTAILLDVKVPFTKRTLSGRVELVCGKARTGLFEEGAVIGILSGKPNLDTVDGDDEELILAGVGMKLEVLPPGEPETEAQRIKREAEEAQVVVENQVVPRIVAYLEGRGGKAKLSDVRAGLTKKLRDYLPEALFRGAHLWTEEELGKATWLTLSDPTADEAA